MPAISTWPDVLTSPTRCIPTSVPGLRYSMVVGDTHWDHPPGETGPPPGPKPTFLFAPDQITKRRREWGGDRFEQTVADSWNRFVPWTDSWLTVRDSTGAVGVDVGVPPSPRGTGRSPDRRCVPARRQRRLTDQVPSSAETRGSKGTGSLGSPCPPRPTSALLRATPTCDDRVRQTAGSPRRPR